jgi:hypothetical protein
MPGPSCKFASSPRIQMHRNHDCRITGKQGCSVAISHRYKLGTAGWSWGCVSADEHAAPVEPNVTMRVRSVQLVFDLSFVAQFSGLRLNERINRNQY